ncbi:MAG TPA: ankyrin repeat domain-containing protein [Chthoniobacteraceae bacterium]|nr:ankyrin repeat domain-containing protein [Chthoniobacteraceae bacterium]
MHNRPETLKRRRRFTLIGTLALALIGAAGWTLYRAIEEKQRNVALWEAVQRGNLSAVTSLLDEGADPNTNEYQVLDFRYGTGTAAILTRLFGREPSYNQDPKTNQWTADPRVPGNWTTRQKWNTVLWLATDKERPDIVRALIARGATDKATGYLHTALMWAAERGYLDIAQSLLAAGSDVNATDDFGGTALDGAAMQEDVEMTKLLLRNGADISRGDALLSAKARGHTAIVELLEKARDADASASSIVPGSERSRDR